MTGQMYLTLGVVLACFLPPFSKALAGPQECAEEIEGCGIGVGTIDNDRWCTCLSQLSTFVNFDFLIHCGIETGASCCPCVNYQSAMARGSSATECASPRDLRLLKRLVRKARRVGKRVAGRCPNGIENCSATRLIAKAQALNCAIVTVSNSIEADCFPEDTN